MAKKYMLISVFDREITTEQFDTKEEAQKSMRKEMIEYGRFSEEIFNEQEYEDGDCGFGAYSAYCRHYHMNDGVKYANLDWLIVAL